MSVNPILSTGSLTSLITMQSSLKTASAVKGAQNELQTEALIYKPSFGFQGDPKKAAELSSKADSLNGKIGEICSDVQKEIQKTNDQNADSGTVQTQTDSQSTADKTDPAETVASAGGQLSVSPSEQNTGDKLLSTGKNVDVNA